MSILNEPKNYELINTCNKCGFCQANCSVYKEMFNEAFATRGRLRLIKAVADGILERTPFYEKIINSCLMCEECSKTCPSGVQGHLLVQLAREDLARENGLSFFKKFAVERVLANNAMRKFSFKSFGLMKKMAKPIKLDSISGVNIKTFPVAKRDFLSSYKLSANGKPKNVKSKKGKPKKVGFFVGCMLNHTLPEVAQSLVSVLENQGCQVIIPEQQRCCGTPAHTYGHAKVSQDVAVANIKVFNELEVDAIVTGCASCGNMLKKYSRIFAEDDEIKSLVVNFSAKVRDINEFLVDDLKISFADFPLSLKGKLTYHDPCHLVRGQNVSSQPRKILNEIAPGQYVEMPNANKCCGAAGMFQSYYPQEAAGISSKKIANINKTQADYVVTSCPACLHRLQGSLDEQGNPQQVMHIIQLLDSALTSNSTA